ncbi:MAG: MerR family transcriptional regulator [Anaerolineae bacterium]|nr:MerR family transcriptional regulator [Anaerolineae bacterium]
MYSVKQISDLAGITVRTVHYYDEIELLKPALTAANGYRYYDDESLYRLQQILFYREMGFDLFQIKKIVDDVAFDRVEALRAHRLNLQAQIKRLTTLMFTVDKTIQHLTGDVKMSQSQLFEGFSPEQEQKYEEEAIRQWGETARQSAALWKNYSAEKKQVILQEGKTIYADLVACMAQGPKSPAVQAVLARWHQHLRYFYEPTPEILEGLGHLYVQHPEFKTNLAELDPALPGFMEEAIAFYVKNLEKK